ncbi:MAG: hypothetical protein HY735_24010 [Verrucomicrobia bacterium]|nr:hypothetical protein [Verrucomicrobiota bacterium]
MYRPTRLRTPDPSSKFRTPTEFDWSSRVPKLLLLVALSLCLSPNARVQGNENFAVGPIYHHGPLTLGDGKRTESGGPLFSHEVTESQQAWTLAPLFSLRKDSAGEFTEFDLAYPLVSYSRFGSDFRFQILQILSWAGGVSLQRQTNSRVTLFPIYFRQRSADPSLNYTALVPFFGRLRNRLFRDEVEFVLFPFYLRSRKREVVTDNYLFPFYHRRHGPGLNGSQIWPLFGAEHKDVTTKTNSFGETETVGGHEKRFLLWPFYFNNRLGIGTDNPESQRVVLPFLSLQRSPRRDSSTYLWPIGVTYTHDREKGYREWGAPWPLVVFARGEGKTANRIWPFFSRAKNDTRQSDFYLWPLYKYNRINSSPLDRERTRVMLFLYSHLRERNVTTGTALERTDLWPLFTVRRDHNGAERLQILSLAEPFFPNSQGIERTYSPVWSIWRSEQNPASGQASQSFLWNLYRNDSTPTSKKCSLLFGLFQYQSGPEGRRVRLFYLPVMKGSQKPAREAKP